VSSERLGPRELYAEDSAILPAVPSGFEFELGDRDFVIGYT